MRKEIKEIENVLQLISRALLIYENQGKADHSIVCDITDSMAAVNCTMFGRENLEAFKIMNKDQQGLVRQVKDWFVFI